MISGKLIFTLIMIVSSPIWIPLCLIYGLIVGPVGYIVFFSQFYITSYQYNKEDYQKYLKTKAAGKWSDAPFFNAITQKIEKPVPPDSPALYAFKIVLNMLGGLLVFVPMGLLIGPFNAIILFWRRLYFSFFPDEILKTGV